MAIGYFPTVDPSRYQVIYQKPSTSPTTATVAPTYRTPVAPPRGVPVATTTTPTTTTTVVPITGKIVTTTTTSGDSFVSGSGGGATTANAGSGSTGASTTPTGMVGGTTATGTESTGGGGGGVDSRLLDLLGGAFQQQDVQQGYAPQSVSSDALSPSSSGSGTNPMAVVVLAIIAMVGIYLWTHRRKAA